MLDLNAKLTSFRKMVWDEEKTKSDAELFRSTQENSAIIDQKREKIDQDLEKSIESYTNFAKLRYNEQISRISEEEKNNFYNHKNLLLDDLVAEIKKELIAFTKTEEYKNKLASEIQDAIKDHGIDENDYELLVKEDDMGLIDFKDIKVMDDRFLGGFILRSKDGSYQFNHSYLNRLDEKKYEIGRTLYESFEREANDAANN